MLIDVFCKFAHKERFADTAASVQHEHAAKRRGSMSTVINNVSNKYFCPVTQKTEMVIIQHTTKRQQQAKDQKEVSFPAKKTLKYCSGLDTCGVMKNNDDNFSFTWDLCPLKGSL